MPTSNTPLPSQELLKLADELAEAVRIERDLPEDGPADDWLAASDRVAVTLGRWLVARLASPVTLEEALMDHLIVVEKSNDTEDRIAAMGAIITHGRTINARRLAGEGGGR